MLSGLTLCANAPAAWLVLALAAPILVAAFLRAWLPSQATWLYSKRLAVGGSGAFDNTARSNATPPFHDAACPGCGKRGPLPAPGPFRCQDCGAPFEVTSERTIRRLPVATYTVEIID